MTKSKKRKKKTEKFMKTQQIPEQSVRFEESKEVKRQLTEEFARAEECKEFVRSKLLQVQAPLH